MIVPPGAQEELGLLRELVVLGNRKSIPDAA